MVVFGILWAGLGLLVFIISILQFSPFTFLLGLAMMGTGLRIANNTLNKKVALGLAEKLKTISFVGMNLKDIEKEIGVHTSVNISNDDNRIYLWEDYLELLCDKNNKCIEVLKNICK